MASDKPGVLERSDAKPVVTFEEEIGSRPTAGEVPDQEDDDRDDQEDDPNPEEPIHCGDETAGEEKDDRDNGDDDQKNVHNRTLSLRVQRGVENESSAFDYCAGDKAANRGNGYGDQHSSDWVPFDRLNRVVHGAMCHIGDRVRRVPSRVQ